MRSWRRTSEPIPRQLTLIAKALIEELKDPGVGFKVYLLTRPDLPDPAIDLQELKRAFGEGFCHSGWTCLWMSLITPRWRFRSRSRGRSLERFSLS